MKLYSSDDTKLQKNIEELKQKIIVLKKGKKELEQKNKDIETKMNNTNN